MAHPPVGSRTGGWAATGLLILAVAAAYYLAARVGLELALVREQVTPLWPPTGIALAGLLLFGHRVWPGIWLGAFLVNLTVGPTLLAVLLISLGNTVAPVCAYLLLRLVGFRTELDRLVDALALVFLGAFAGMLVSSAIGTGTLTVVGAVPAERFAATWSVWWTGDAMGVLVVTPLLLVARTIRPPRGVPAVRWAEAAALLLGTAAVTFAVTRAPTQLLFLVFPLLVWAALRFQLVGAAPCAVLVSVLAVQAAEEGVGPFAGLDLLPTMVVLQAFNGAAALTGLLLAVIAAERDRAQQAVDRACATLAAAVERLEPDGSLLQGRLLDVVRKAQLRSGDAED